jgi:hypothetical protein
MTDHLHREELIDALDGTLAESKAAHLSACAACRGELASLRAVLEDARGLQVPPPSPLFWDHFSRRVREATADVPAPGGAGRWRRWWQPAGLVAAAAGVVVLVLALRLPAPDVTSVPDGGPVAAIGTLDDDGSWGLVLDLASEFDMADVREAAKPAYGTADAMIAELTDAQRSAFARMLADETGEQ